MTRISRDAKASLCLFTAAGLLLSQSGCAISPATFEPIEDPEGSSNEASVEDEDDEEYEEEDEASEFHDAGAADFDLDAGSAEAPDASDLLTDATSGAFGPLTMDGGTEGSTAPLCQLSAGQIGLIGDSYLALSGEVTAALEQHARAGGAIGPDEHFRDHSVAGASFGYLPSISSQFSALREAAVASGGVKFVIMNGGGNDMLVFNRGCLDEWTPSIQCRLIVEQSLRAFSRLLLEMSMAGVERVIYFWYPDLPGGGGLSGVRPQVVNRYAAPRFEQVCRESVLPACHFVPTQPVFAGHPEYISPLDRVHPTAAGSRAIAALLWDVMLAQCPAPG